MIEEEITDNKILRYLDYLPAGHVYMVAPKPVFLKGYDYYRRGRVEGFEWVGDDTLVATVIGTRSYSTSIAMQDGNPAFRCTCPAWASASNCKHVACAVLTAKNLLDPKLFTKPRNPEADRLLSELTRIKKTAIDKKHRPKEKSVSNKEPKGYQIVIEKLPYVSDYAAEVYKGDRKIYSTSGVPKELRKIIEERSLHYPFQSPINYIFLDYLVNNNLDVPISVRLQDRLIPLALDKDTVYSPRTELDMSGKNISVTPVCSSGEISCKEFLALNDHVIIDLERKRLSPLAPSDGWDIWLSIVRAAQPENSGVHSPLRLINKGVKTISMPKNEFIKNIQIEGDVKKKDQITNTLELKVAGEVVSAAPERFSCALMAERDKKEKDSFVLKASLICGGELFRPSSAQFALFTVWNDGIWGLPQRMRAKKRLRGLVDIFLRILNERNHKEREKAIKNCLKGNDLFDRSLKGGVSRLLSDASEAFESDLSRVVPVNGTWALAESRVKEISVLYAIPYELFGIRIFEDMMTLDEMRVEEKAFYKRLPELYGRLTELGIPLLINEKPVSVASWDFQFDAREPSGLDWFEIRPEIRCDGSAVDEDTWRRIAAGNGFIEDGEGIRILDPKSMDILGLMADIYPQKASKRESREIVSVPRLQILDWLELRKKGVKVKLPKEVEEVAERLTRLKGIDKRPLPDGLRSRLRHYQEEGYSWLSFLYENRFGGCLADDMGLGKTIQAISLLAGIREGKVGAAEQQGETPHLVVVPPSLLFNWENEIGKFYPDFKICSYVGGERKPDFSGCDLVLTTYGLIRRDIERLKEVQFNVVIFDEAQAVKNILAATTGAVRQLKGRFKLAITGTPVENHIGEYYSIMDLVLPGLLGEGDGIRGGRKAESQGRLEMVVRRTRPFVMRRTKDEILKELPPKTESDIYLELTELQKGLYKKTVEMVKSEINDAYAKKTEAQAHIIALTAILKLRQLCVSPKLIDKTANEPSPKIEFLCSKLSELLDEGHSALVFSQFTSFLDIIENELLEKCIPYSRLDGSTAVGKRKRLVEEFQSGNDASVFLLSLKAGGQGLNLTKASYVFHLDPWWNPAVENQASDRAHRIGQKNKVTITRILMHHTIEEKMMKLKEKKQALFNAIMDGADAGKKGFSVTKADFDFLLG